MAEPVDSLQIEIEASSTAAAGAIDRLTASLQRLGQAVKRCRGLNGSPSK